MAGAERRAEVVWRGDLFSGEGTLGLVTSGVVSDLPVSWPARTEEAGGKTSPEELIAGAHAACYAMAFSNTLSQAGNPPERLDVSATVSFEGGKVTTSVLEVRGRVPGLDAEGFRRGAEEGERSCPVSNALRGNVEIRVNASLES